jgi:hypothetical protein
VSIDKSGKWWVGSEPEDLRPYLEAYASEGYEVHEFRLARCSCGSNAFELFADDDEGTAKRICASCKSEHYICDSEEYWSECGPEQYRCECGSDFCNVGVGFSLYPERDAIKWLYVGERCAKCGILGCFAGWKIAYTPSLQLMEQV